MVNRKLYGILLFWAISSLAMSCDMEPDPSSYLPNIAFDYSGSQTGSFLLFHTPPDTTAEIYSGSGDTSYSVTGVRWKDSHRHADIFILSFHNPDTLTSGMTLSTENPRHTIKAEFGINSEMTTIHNVSGDKFFIADSSQYKVKSMTVNLLTFNPLKLDTTSYSVSYNYHIEFFGILVNSKGEQITISNGGMIDRFPYY